MTIPKLTLRGAVEHPVRSLVLDALASVERKEQTIAALCILTRSGQVAISRAVSVLEEHGVVQVRHEGRHTFVSPQLLSEERLLYVRRQARLLAARGIDAPRIARMLRVLRVVVSEATVAGWLAGNESEPPPRGDLN